MELFGHQDTTRLLPPQQDTVRVKDSIPATIIQDTLLDLDSIMKQIEIREETIKTQQVRTVIPVQEPDPVQVFYYSPEIIWEGYSHPPVFSVLRKPAKKIFTKDIIPLPVLENENPAATRKDGKSYLQYLEKPSQYNHINTTQAYPGWTLYIFLFSFLAITLLKMAYTRFPELIMKAVISHKENLHLYSNKNSITQNTFLVLQFLFALNVGFFLFLTGKYFDILPEFPEFYLILIFSASVFFLYQFKYTILYLLGFFFDQVKAFAEYIHSISIFNKFLGIILIPVIAGMVIMNEYFTQYFIYTGMGFIVILYLVRVVKGAGIILRKGFSVFYLFLYLCALEIFPLLIVYKLLELRLI